MFICRTRFGVSDVCTVADWFLLVLLHVAYKYMYLERWFMRGLACLEFFQLRCFNNASQVCILFDAGCLSSRPFRSYVQLQFLPNAPHDCFYPVRPWSSYAPAFL